MFSADKFSAILTFVNMFSTEDFSADRAIILFTATLKGEEERTEILVARLRKTEIENGMLVCRDCYLNKCRVTV